MASNISLTTLLYDCEILPENVKDLNSGDCRHLRPFLGDGILCVKDFIYWMTDRTPHEGLEMDVGGYRKFFRVVEGDVGVWFEEHSTVIKKCELPEEVRVIQGSKFRGDVRVKREAKEEGKEETKS
ncbi:hypothetical protein TrLO_g559 [Triparma laevis f. longispina]|uniref:Uncharacterized protein n=1 Tax=Triparma laevis f. longispina TaxID=1714387 RepID=A0A9W7AUG6_9STRA|nr:hypothetical protein TrLO_g559 [Triparma laevis f. longispina]